MVLIEFPMDKNYPALSVVAKAGDQISGRRRATPIGCNGRQWTAA